MSNSLRPHGLQHTRTPFSSVQVSHSVVSDSLWPHGLQHARPPCPSPTPGVYSNSCPLSRWCHPTISSSVVPFSSHLQFNCGLGAYVWFDPSIFTDTYFVVFNVVLSSVDRALVSGPLPLLCPLKGMFFPQNLLPGLFPQRFQVSVQMSSALYGPPWPPDVKCDMRCTRYSSPFFLDLVLSVALRCVCVCVCVCVFKYLPFTRV